MKNLFLMLCFLVVSTFACAMKSADDKTLAKNKKEILLDEKTQENTVKINNPECEVICFVEIDGVIYSAKAKGGDCVNRCVRKLARVEAALSE